MALDPNKFTRKTQEALGAAQAAGRDAGHTEIAPEHLLARAARAARRCCQRRAGAHRRRHRRGAAARSTKRCERVPKVTGATVRDARLAPAAFALLEAADKEREQLDDEYLSTEHLLLAMTDVVGWRG